MVFHDLFHFSALSFVFCFFSSQFIINIEYRDLNYSCLSQLNWYAFLDFTLVYEYFSRSISTSISFNIILCYESFCAECGKILQCNVKTIYRTSMSIFDQTETKLQVFSLNLQQAVNGSRPNMVHGSEKVSSPLSLSLTVTVRAGNNRSHRVCFSPLKASVPSLVSDNPTHTAHEQLKQITWGTLLVILLNP